MLEHGSTFCDRTFAVGLQQPATHEIVMAIHRSRFVAVQARTVASEGNEIPQPLPRGRGSVWRAAKLTKERYNEKLAT